MKRTRLVLALLALSTSLGCRTDPSPPLHAASPELASSVASIDGAVRFTVQAREIDQVFQVDVWQPLGVEGELPVLYVLDGNTTFGMVTNMVLPMMYAGDVPPTIIVGIGYQVDSPSEIAVRRARDLLPTPEADFAERMSRAGFPVVEGVTPGGADAFLAFIDDEVKPLVADHYPVDVEDQTLVGYSYGGTFAFHALLSSPESFDRYVIGSPVLARDGGELITREDAFARSRRALDATVFLSAGEYEVENGILEPTVAMMETLRSRRYEGLRLLTHVFPEETHESAIAPTISRGLRAVFGTWPRGGDAGED